ncbi:MAG TPA: ABC transporter permease [Bacteroidales bacterium]|nr:ABC transporter permease [Bacteroidales bacterium]
MIKNLLKTAIRHLTKHVGYSAINILGLTLGIASALFLIIYVTDEISYDNYHKNGDRIYRVASKLTETDDQFTWIVAQIPFGPQVVKDYPEVQSYVRFFNMPQGAYKYEDKEYTEQNFYYADSTVFDIFTYRIIKGDAKAAVTEPKKIVLTESAAVKYFGDTDPIGKVLNEGSNSYEVTAVMEDVPSNSHFRFDALASRNNLPKQFGSWGNFGVFTYLLLPKDIDISAFEKKIQGMSETHVKPVLGPYNVKVDYILEPIKRIHLHSTNASEPEPTGSIAYVIIFAIVALFLVLIAAMNYMNLATARSAGRAREVGLRKVVGSTRTALIMQFLSESVVFTVVSLILSIIILLAALPKLNLYAGKSFDFSLLYSPVLILAFIGTIILVGIIGGSYPAFFLSRFNPQTVLKGDVTKGSAGNLFRKILVVIQFTVSVIMIMCTLLVYRQLNYMKSMDQGFDQENVVFLQLNGATAAKYKLLKQNLLENPDIKAVSGTNTPIGEGSGKVLFNVETDQGMAQKGINFAVADHDFIETMGIKIKEGRDFQQDMPSDTSGGVVVNETFVKRMGWKEAIGKRVELSNSNQIVARVIGVMKDYHQTGMYNEVETFMLVYRGNQMPVVYVRLSGNNNQKDISFIETKWKELFPDQPFSYTFLKDRFNRQFEADEKRGTIFTLFTILAILIACLGLFGLASYTVERRTKEIGIRKVFGADEGIVVGLISKDFLILVSAGILIAIPAAYWFMSNWLENYVYRTKIGFSLILLSALLTVAITFITISYKAFQAAATNPAKSIRTE